LIAKLENLGPFSFFFTLSCADMRWSENFTSLLQDQHISYKYSNGEEQININDCDWQEWLKENESRHDFIKNNLLNATLTFHHRVKMFIKHIIKSKGNPLKISYHSYKVEFALRGAAHVHGVLWIDWENIDILSKKDTQLIKDALKKIKNEQKIEDNERNAIAKFADEFISCSLKNPKTADIVQSVNVHNHTKTCKKYGSDCRFYFPRFPTLKTIVAVPLQHSDIPVDKQEIESCEAKRILSSVKVVLQDEQAMEEICEINKEKIDIYVQTLNLVQKIGLILSETPKKKQTICLDEKNVLKHLYL